MSAREFGARLRLARKDRQLTQRQAATQLGVRPSTVSRWEDGLRAITPRYYDTLARFMGISRQQLLAWVHDASDDGVAARVEKLEERFDRLEDQVSDLVRAVRGGGQARR